MQIAAGTTKSQSQSLPGATLPELPVTVRHAQFFQYRMIRCNGVVANFGPSDILAAATRVSLTVDGTQGAALAELQLAGNRCREWQAP